MPVQAPLSLSGGSLKAARFLRLLSKGAPARKPLDVVKRDPVGPLGLGQVACVQQQVKGVPHIAIYLWRGSNTCNLVNDIGAYRLWVERLDGAASQYIAYLLYGIRAKLHGHPPERT